MKEESKKRTELFFFQVKKVVYEQVTGEVKVYASCLFDTLSFFIYSEVVSYARLLLYFSGFDSLLYGLSYLKLVFSRTC